GSWTVGEDILVAADLLLEQAASARPAGAVPSPSPRDETATAEPELLLVCTHGRHDVCCAVRGRPVAAALAAEWPEATWECSHTGGDRFAANVIALPDGACYGGLDPDTAVSVLRRHLGGAPDTAYLRGRTGYPPAAQAALAAVHSAVPEAHWGEVALSGMTSEGPTHRVRLRGVHGEFEVIVTEHVAPPQQLTCAATSHNRATVPVAGEVRPLS
ncbi:MAG: sucrase ferredoxin, partial [Ornithinimicrobium sp.]